MTGPEITRATLLVVPSGDRELLVFRVRRRDAPRRQWAVWRPRPEDRALAGFAGTCEPPFAPGRAAAEIEIPEERDGEARVRIRSGSEEDGYEIHRIDEWFAVQRRLTVTRFRVDQRDVALLALFFGIGGALALLRLGDLIGDGLMLLAFFGDVLLIIGVSFLSYRCPVCRHHTNMSDKLFWRGASSGFCRTCGAPV